MEANAQSMKAVFTVVDRGAGRSYWTRVGIGFVNRDGSITLKLDAIPVNGTLQVRDWESREDAARRPLDQEAPPPLPRSRMRRDDATAPLAPSHAPGRPRDGVDGLL